MIHSGNRYLIICARVSFEYVHDKLLNIYNDTFNKIKDISEQYNMENIPEGFPKT
jgi:hypothetical protein